MNKIVINSKYIYCHKDYYLSDLLLFRKGICYLCEDFNNGTYIIFTAMSLDIEFFILHNKKLIDNNFNYLRTEYVNISGEKFNEYFYDDNYIKMYIRKNKIDNMFNRLNQR